MPLLFWLAIVTYLVFVVITVALALMVFEFAPWRSLNRFFVLCISLVAAPGRVLEGA